MKTSNVTKILAAALAGCIFTGYLGAQGTAPNATVDANGNLVLESGQVIAPPSGTVNEAGNLVIDGNEIVRPTATINASGELVLADGTILPVPEFPAAGGLETVFGDTLAPLEGKTEGSDGWYFSYNFKAVYHWGASFPNFIFIERMGSIAYVDTASGSIADGIWVYAFDLPTAGNGTWVFLKDGAGFLIDVRDLDGPSNSQKRINGSFVYLTNPGGGAAEGWFTFLENSARTASFVAPAGTNTFTQVWPRM